LLETLIYANATQATQPGLPSTGSMETLVIFLAIIAIIVARRIARGIYGRRYSTGRVLFLPVFYVLLTLVFVIFLNLGDTDIYYTLLLIPAGAVMGLRIGGGISFFMKNGEVYYRRSPVILIIWLASYVSRILLEVLYPTNRTIAFAVDVVLALTAGLIIGEAVHLIQGRRSFNPAPEKEEDRFVINQ
jgi:hypothetical protein